MQPEKDATATAICSSCGNTGIPKRNMAKGVLSAIGMLLSFPVLLLVFGAIWGADFLHNNSMFLTFAFFAFVGGAVSLIKGAWIGACPSCGTEPMVLLSTAEGQHLLQNIKFRICPQCSKPFTLDISILKSPEEGEAVTSVPCPSCSTALSVNMNNYEVTVK